MIPRPKFTSYLRNQTTNLIFTKTCTCGTKAVAQQSQLILNSMTCVMPTVRHISYLITPCLNGETTWRQLSKRLPDYSTIFAAEATAIKLALNYYQHMGPVHHDVVLYSDSMSYLQAIETEDTENPLIGLIMDLPSLLSDRSTRVRFCWIPSHCGIGGNERVDQLAKDTLDQEIDPLASVHYTDLKSLVNPLHSAVSSNQVGCGCTWPRSQPRETSTGTNKEIPELNQSWRGCNHHTKAISYISCPEDHRLSTLSIGHMLLWPLLLTWFNFNPSMDK